MGVTQFRRSARNQSQEIWTDATSGEPVVPNGSMDFRYADSPVSRWNLDLAGVTPALSIRDVDANATLFGIKRKTATAG